MSMKIIKTALLSPQQKEKICTIWNTEYPKNLALTSAGFEEYLATSTNQTHYLILEDSIEIAGWAYTFDRQREKWFSIIIDHLYQGRGLGHLLINLIKEKETQLNGWVIDHGLDLKQNGEPYRSPLPFYLQHGFVPNPSIRLEDEKISAIKIHWKKA